MPKIAQTWRTHAHVAVAEAMLDVIEGLQETRSSRCSSSSQSQRVSPPARAGPIPPEAGLHLVINFMER
jgi:hypothetical protein